MQRGLRNGTVSVRLYVYPVYTDRCSNVRRVCCCGPGEQKISIDCIAAAGDGAQQHGGQQQMRAVSRCQLT